MTLPAFLIVSFCAQAEILDIHTRFEKGQRLTLEIRKSSEDKTLKAANWVAATPVSVTVLEAGEKGFVLDWTPGETRFENPEQASQPMTKIGAGAMKDIHLEVQLNGVGQPQALRNTADVQAAVKQAVEGMSQQLSAGMRDDAQRKAFLAALPRAISVDGLVTIVLGDMAQYLSLSGVSLDSAKPLKTKGISPHPLGEVGKISSEIEMTVRNIDNDTKEALIAFRQQFDPNGFAGMTLRVLAQSGLKISLGQRMPEISLVDTIDYVLDLTYGFPRRLRRVRTLAAGDLSRRVDSTEIIMKMAGN